MVWNFHHFLSPPGSDICEYIPWQFTVASLMKSIWSADLANRWPWIQSAHFTNDFIQLSHFTFCFAHLYCSHILRLIFHNCNFVTSYTIAHFASSIVFFVIAFFAKPRFLKLTLLHWEFRKLLSCGIKCGSVPFPSGEKLGRPTIKSTNLNVEVR